MPVGEAIDLVLTLPAGSMYAASKDPYQAWTDERRALADIRDIMRACQKTKREREHSARRPKGHKAF